MLISKIINNNVYIQNNSCNLSPVSQNLKKIHNTKFWTLTKTNWHNKFIVIGLLPRIAISTWRRWSPEPIPAFLYVPMPNKETGRRTIKYWGKNFRADHFLQISGAFRSVPSPLQGTSHKTRSNCKLLLLSSSSPLKISSWSFMKEQVGKCCASWFVTTKLAVHILFVWWIRRLHLWTSTSLAITCIIKQRWFWSV